MKKISIISPCYNEEGNIEEFYKRVSSVINNIESYEFEIIFEDNCSTDNTINILRNICAEDKRVKVIRNVRNFGPLRSSAYLTLQAYGDAVIALPCDLQDPPELIPDFLQAWESGYKLVLGQKNKSEENKILFSIRKLYYKIMGTISDVDHYENVGTYVLYDQSIVQIFRWMKDPYPYIRNIICDLGYTPKLISYTQKRRKKGKSSYTFLKYLDVAITGVTSSSKLPLRLVSYLGIFMAFLSFCLAIAFFILKLTNWNSYQLGMAPLLIGLFFFSSIQLICIGILGEYIGAILTKVTRRPLVVEEERINFDDGENRKVEK